MSATAVVLAVALTVAACLAAASPASRISQEKEPRKVKAVYPMPTARAEACCADLGCYSSGGDFFSLLNRPINSVPNCRIQDNLRLHLNTRRNPVQTQVLDPYNAVTIEDSHFNASAKTQIIIHGFADGYWWPWWVQTVSELLKDGNHNVIRLDWSAGNLPPYLQATANVRLVGSYVAKFIHHLVSVHGVNPADVHIIGHSLGAHGAGYAGTVTQQQHNFPVGRITGLDPAGPYFTNLPVSVRLDPSDATVVDTIVTDGETIFNWAFGSHQAMGHINFYPNGGKNQPGCDQGILATIFGGPTMNSTTFDVLGTAAATSLEVVACNHARAPVLFYESINNPACTMKSFQCSDYDSFLRGECFSCRGQRCAALGYHANLSLAEGSGTKNFYTLTTSRSPFCTSPHKIQFTLKTKAAESSSKDKLGYVYVTLYGSLATSARVQLTPEAVELNPGQTYTFFFETPRDLGTVESVVFYWEARFLQSMNPLEWFRTQYIYLEGSLLLIEQDELVSMFRPAREQVEEKKVLLASLTHSFEQ
ncbi:Pancreatic triacylglycerol lipase [Hypsibius exemplaris]|uniref:Pancreatic triacylglycerol lipase n=1 Tax=Hypsibius exemplaris TaxID=2072580 RepID=A0A1W0WKN6_HYPEX|nr:Pancreatic triacylglycerol lipase [Hypsibius exemplaris]